MLRGRERELGLRELVLLTFYIFEKKVIFVNKNKTSKKRGLMARIKVGSKSNIILKMGQKLGRVEHLFLSEIGPD